MTATVTTNFDVPIPGFACGSSVIDDGYTIDTGLGDTVAFYGNASTADTVVTVTSQTKGIVTLALKTASAGATGQTLRWIAWRKQK